MASYFAIQSPRAPWGSYGDILWHGLLDDDDAASPLAKLSRTGPFVPPLTQPFGGIIVVDSVRRRLEGGRFSGLDFVKIAYGTTVRLDWRTWDPLAPTPPFYPEGGEPENYIEGVPHDPMVAAEMPALWAFDVAVTQGLQMPNSSRFYADRHPGTDIAREAYVMWVSERLKQAIEGLAGPWVRFEAVVPG